MKKFKYFLLSLIIITTFLLLDSVFYPNIVIEDRTIDVGSDEIIEAKAFNLFNDLSKRVTSTGTVDNNVVGEYVVECKINYLFYRVRKKFTISVVDREKPSIELKGDNPAIVCPNCTYKEEGYSASDNYDKDMEKKFVISEVEGKIIYSVTDSSGNTSVAERKIIYEDKEKPVIELNGSAEVSIYLGNPYRELGYKANDNCDGDITDNVKVNSDVETNKLGTYRILYEVEDNSGNKTSVERKVHVKEKPSYYGNGVIYLTFDDGPSYLTPKVLDILDRENVKATFFVTSANDSTKRAYNNGHTIAMHSYSHNYSYIYASSSNYFADLNKLSNNIYNVIGIRPKIIRFPGGSSNTVSSLYSTGIMSYLTNEVVNRGYNYFDWNVDANDAGSDIKNSTNIYYNVINNLSHNKTNVVLIHDSGGHNATVEALDDIIRYGKDNGYTFKAITMDTPVVRHGVNN